VLAMLVQRRKKLENKKIVKPSAIKLVVFLFKPGVDEFQPGNAVKIRYIAAEECKVVNEGSSGDDGIGEFNAVSFADVCCFKFDGLF
jgi:hypothetical protein